MNTCTGVGPLEVKNELFEILDAVDVVVGWRRNQPHTRGSVTQGRDPRIHLVGRELPTFAGFCSLGHLDLQVFCHGEVEAGNTKPPRRDLFDFAPQFGVSQSLRRLSSLSGVASRAELIHRLSQCLVHLRRDGAHTHCSRSETPNDGGCRFHLFEGNRGAPLSLEGKQAPQSHEALRLIIHGTRVFAENIKTPRAG